jgi:hypothetical protein
MFSFAVLALCASAFGAAIEKRIPVPDGYVAPPYYPAPHGGWTSDWAESYRKASLIVSNLTLAEKTNITAGTGIFMGRCVGNTGSALRAGIPQLYEHSWLQIDIMLIAEIDVYKTVPWDCVIRIITPHFRPASLLEQHGTRTLCMPVAWL